MYILSAQLAKGKTIPIFEHLQHCGLPPPPQPIPPKDGLIQFNCYNTNSTPTKFFLLKVDLPFTIIAHNEPRRPTSEWTISSFTISQPTSYFCCGPPYHLQNIKRRASLDTKVLLHYLFNETLIESLSYIFSVRGKSRGEL